jgi:hypothetical protein
MEGQIQSGDDPKKPLCRAHLRLTMRGRISIMKPISLACFLVAALLLTVANPASGAQDAPTVDSVLEKFIKASGGKAALEKISSRMIQGKLETQMIPVAADWRFYAKSPDKQFVEVDIPGLGKSEDAFDGQVAWSKSAAGLRAKTGDELAKARRDAQFMRELNFKIIFPNLVCKGTEKLEGEEVNVLEFKTAGDSKETFYFGKNTGLLLRQDSEFSTSQGKVTSKAAFSDYRSVDAINFSHLIKGSLNMAGQELEFTLKITEVKHNTKMEDSKFSKPSE